MMEETFGKAEVVLGYAGDGRSVPLFRCAGKLLPKINTRGADSRQQTGRSLRTQLWEKIARGALFKFEDFRFPCST